MRTFLLLAPTIAFLTPTVSAPETISLAVEAGTKVTKTYTSSLELELESFNVVVDGEEMDDGDMPEFSVVDESQIVFVDEYVAVEDGAAIEIVRTFETLADSSNQTSTGPDGEPFEEESEGESELEGKSVRFKWDGDTEEYDISFAEDDEDADASLLDGLMADADFLMLLPGEDIEVGDSWEIEALAVDGMMNPSGDLKIISEDDEEGDDFDQQFRDNIEGELEGTLVSIEDGVAKIAIKGEITSNVTKDGAPDDAPDGMDIEMSQLFEMTYEAEGELLWDMERGIAKSLTIAGALTLEITINQSFGGQEAVIEQTLTGEFLDEATFE